MQNIYRFAVLDWTLKREFINHSECFSTISAGANFQKSPLSYN